MRLVVLSLALAVSLDQAALAQSGSVVDNGVKRIRSVVIWGDDPCPKAGNPDEIVVCARRPETERYRLPPSTREQAIRKRSNRAWASRSRDLNSLGVTGSGTCTPVGPNGDTGCVLKNIQNATDEKRDAADEAAADTPTTRPR